MTDNNYDEGYLSWKNWGGDKFGELIAKDSSDFSSEISRTKRRFIKGSRVLDVGFGNGNFLAFSKKKNWEVTGIEINKNLIDIALEKGFDVIHCKSLEQFNSDTFDLVVAFDVLEHFDHNSVEMFLREIKRILKNDGIFLAKFPNGDSPFGLSNQNGDITHLISIGSNKARYWADNVGLEIVYIGANAMPILTRDLKFMLQRFLSVPIRKTLNFITNLIFFPRFNISFFSRDLTLILRKPE
tara:strand:+ start:209 stop:931 length:723 start_codon:yes stop_codon:yes gene_type:complete